MTDIIAFEIYRTENMTINGECIRVNFTQRKDLDEYALFAVNGSGTKRWSGFYSAATATEFTHCTGLEMEEEVYSILRIDIEQGLVR